MAWINPRYRELTGHEPPGRAAAVAGEGRAEGPRDDGIRLAALTRDAKGQREELRVSLAEYEGHRYLSLRVWSLDRRSEQWWPVKGKGLSVRLREAEDVAAALLRGLAIVEEEAGRTPRRPPQGGPLSRAREPGVYAGGDGLAFDEFNG